MYSSLQHNNIIGSVKISSNNQGTRDVRAMQKMKSASPINHSWQQAGLWQRDGWQQRNKTVRNAPYVQLVTLSLYCHTSVPHYFMISVREDHSQQPLHEDGAIKCWWRMVPLTTCNIHLKTSWFHKQSNLYGLNFLKLKTIILETAVLVVSDSVLWRTAL